MKKVNDSKHWAQTDERGSLFGIMFMLYTFKLLGSTVCKIFMVPVLVYYYLFNRQARKNQTDYLQKLNSYFPDAPKASQWHVLKVFFNFGFGIVDRMAAWQGKVKQFKLTKVNNQAFIDLREKKQGAVIVIAHLGNFEISRMASDANKGAVFNVFMHTKNAKKFTEAIKKFNPEFAMSVIQGDALNMQLAIALKEKVDAGEFVVIAGDRTPVKNQAAVVNVDFLGHQAQLPIGPYVLAKVLDCPLIALYCLKERAGYQVIFESLADEIKFGRNDKQLVLQRYAQQYALSMEHQLKSAPLQWYNFHNFWKKQ